MTGAVNIKTGTSALSSPASADLVPIYDDATGTWKHVAWSTISNLVVGLLDDRGNYDASGNTFPSSGGSGAAGAIMKGDIWRISVAGQLGGVQVVVGDWVRALSDSPGQTAGNWAINSGGQSDQMVYIGTWASRPAASSVIAGSRARFTDVGPAPGTSMFSDGTDWRPVNGRALVDKFRTAYGIAPSGTINTGSSGNLTLGTALYRAFTEGIWLYLPSIATTPAITAGWYWVVQTTTTLGTIYSNGPGSAALNITSGGSYTGSTSEQTARTVAIQGGLPGTDGALEASGMLSYNNSAGTKTFKYKYGGNLFGTGAPSTTASFYAVARIENQGAANVQRAIPGVQTGFNANAVGAFALNTAADQNVTITLQLATATDWVIIEGGDLWLVK